VQSDHSVAHRGPRHAAVAEAQDDSLTSERSERFICKVMPTGFPRVADAARPSTHAMRGTPDLRTLRKKAKLASLVCRIAHVSMRINMSRPRHKRGIWRTAKSHDKRYNDDWTVNLTMNSSSTVPWIPEPCRKWQLHHMQRIRTERVITPSDVKLPAVVLPVPGSPRRSMVLHHLSDN